MGAAAGIPPRSLQCIVRYESVPHPCMERMR